MTIEQRLKKLEARTIDDRRPLSFDRFILRTPEEKAALKVQAERGEVELLHIRFFRDKG
ncbi:MAG: hypothetical protein WCP87_01490 [Atribacterota bacterium]